VLMATKGAGFLPDEAGLTPPALIGERCAGKGKGGVFRENAQDRVTGPDR
jgi:hypothetical protein